MEVQKQRQSRVWCWRCLEYGPIQRDCRAPVVRQAKRKVNQGNENSPGQDEAVGWDVANKVHKEKRKFTVNLAGTPKCVTIKLAKQKFRSLIDTGAEVSLISEKVFKSMKQIPKLTRRKVSWSVERRYM